MSKVTSETDWTSYYEQLYRFALKLCRDVNNAEDLVQQTYAQALTKRDQFVEGTRLDSWLYRILQNLYFNQRQASAVIERKQHLFLVDDSEVENSNHLEASRSLDQVIDAVSDIPEQYRIVLILIAVEGFSYKEVAESLQVPVGTVTSRLARARSMVIDRCVRPAGNKMSTNLRKV